MHGGEVLIPLVMFIGGFTMVIFLRRYMYLERKMMIERGMKVRDFGQRFRDVDGGGHYRALRLGLLAMGAGLGLFVGNIISGEQAGEHPGITFGLVMLFGGFGLVTSYAIQMYMERNNPKTNSTSSQKYDVTDTQQDDSII